jgi:hypothetical protein
MQSPYCQSWNDTPTAKRSCSFNVVLHKPSKLQHSLQLQTLYVYTFTVSAKCPECKDTMSRNVMLYVHFLYSLFLYKTILNCVELVTIDVLLWTWWWIFRFCNNNQYFNGENQLLCIVLRRYNEVHNFSLGTAPPGYI